MILSQPQNPEFNNPENFHPCNKHLNWALRLMIPGLIGTLHKALSLRNLQTLVKAKINSFMATPSSYAKQLQNQRPSFTSRNKRQLGE